MTATDEQRALNLQRRSDNAEVMAEQQDAEDEVYERVREQERMQAEIRRGNRRGARITVADIG